MSQVVDLIKETFKGWSEDKVSRLAAALAYYTVFAIPPLLLLSLGLVGLFVERQMAEEFVLRQAGQLIGPQGREVFTTILQSSDTPSGGLGPTIIGIALLLFAASGVFVQLEDAMNTIWNVEAKESGGILNVIKERLLSFTVVLVIGFVLLVSLFLSTALASFSNYIGGLVTERETVLWVLNLIVSLLVYTAFFATIFKYVADVEVRWRDVLVGAAITAVLFKIGEYALAFYFDRSDPASAYGAASSVILLLLWVYYSAQILFIGAEFTEVYTQKFGGGMRPEEGAVILSPEDRAEQGIPTEQTKARAAERQHE